MKQKDNIVFLAIDGVLLSIGAHPHLHTNVHAIKQGYVHKEPKYQKVSAFDLVIVKFGWKKQAIKNLRQLIEESKASLVISSSWRIGRSLEVLKLLFEVHGLGTYVKDIIVEADQKEEGIEMYIGGYEIQHYVILDDLDMEGTFHNHMVHVSEGYLSETNVKEALRILKI